MRRAAPLVVAAALVCSGLAGLWLHERRPSGGGPPVDRPWFGYNELKWSTGWQQGDGPDPDARMHAAIAATAEGGANTDILGVLWSDVAAHGDAAWNRYDDAYQAMIVRGIRPIVAITGAPAALRAPGCDRGRAAPPAPAHYPAWRQFVARAGARFPEALGFQVWNEPNSLDFWGGAGCVQSRAEREDSYVELVRLAREAIPAATIVTAGLNPASHESITPWTQYLREIVDRGVLDSAAVIGLHPYPTPADCPRAAHSEPTPAGRLAAGMRDQLDQADALVPGARLWVTEFGASSAAGAADCRGLGEAGQAGALAAMYDLIRGRPEIEVAVVHQLVDSPAVANPYWREFGTTTVDPFTSAEPRLRRKPSFRCLAARRGIAEADPGSCAGG